MIRTDDLSPFSIERIYWSEQLELRIIFRVVIDGKEVLIDMVNPFPPTFEARK